MKNILLLMSDEHRTDHVGCYPGARVATPNIDRLSDGVVFATCVSSNPICTPARSALLTGKYTHQIGMLDMSGDLNRQHPTYARALQAAGYYTAGFGKFHWLQGWPWRTPARHGHDLVALESEIKRFGFDHVWEASGKQLAVKDRCHYAEYLTEKGLHDAYCEYVTERKVQEKRAPNVDPATYPDGEPFPLPEEDYADIVVTNRIVEAIRQRPRDRPFFMLASLCGPHPPYDPPKRFLDQVPYEEPDDFVPGDAAMPESEKKRWWKLRRAYKAMVLCVDEQVGRILDTLESEGVLDDTVVLFTADHGGMLGDRGLNGKAVPWRQASVVPAMIRHPDHLESRTNDSPVELTDLTATILDTAGLDPQMALSKPWPAFHDRVPCRSLMPIVRGETEAVRDYAFAECEDAWELIRTRRTMYVHTRHRSNPDDTRDAFFDLSDDPESLDNRIDDPARSAEIEWCRRRLQFVKDTTPAAQTQWAPHRGAGGGPPLFDASADPLST